MKSIVDEVLRASSSKQKPGSKQKYADKLKSIEELKHEARVEISHERATNREKIHDDLIALHKSLAGYDNPYASLEIALRIIQSLTGDKTLTAGYEDKIEVVRARALRDENAKLYAWDRIDTMIDTIANNEEMDEIEKARVIDGMRLRKQSFE